MPAIVRQKPWLSAFSLLYLAGFTVFGFSRGDPQALTYLIAVGLAMAFVARLFTRVRLSDAVLWALAAWGALHMAGGLIPVGDGVLYNQAIGVDVVRYDRLVHAFGFGAATVAAWQTLRRWIRMEEQIAGGLGVLVALIGMGVGAFNEVIEFVTTMLAENTNIGGYDNTGWDLIANAIGATVAASWVVRRPHG